MNLLLELKLSSQSSNGFCVLGNKQQKVDYGIPVFVVPVKAIGCGVLFELAIPLTWVLIIS